MSFGLFDNDYNQRLLDRTFYACRTVLGEGSLSDPEAITAVSRCSHLPSESVRKYMEKLSFSGVIFHRDGRFAMYKSLA
ncbi:MAG: hypothetical protein PHF67_01280 [Candidatus Nanoarchaeia archaeon]|nr:hypothetical protein [Candidatus Nanoarchaeia archaeon]